MKQKEKDILIVKLQGVFFGALYTCLLFLIIDMVWFK